MRDQLVPGITIRPGGLCVSWVSGNGFVGVHPPTPHVWQATRRRQKHSALFQCSHMLTGKTRTLRTFYCWFESGWEYHLSIGAWYMWLCLGLQIPRILFNSGCSCHLRHIRSSIRTRHCARRNAGGVQSAQLCPVNPDRVSLPNLGEFSILALGTVCKTVIMWVRFPPRSPTCKMVKAIP